MDDIPSDKLRLPDSSELDKKQDAIVDLVNKLCYFALRNKVEILKYLQTNLGS